MLTVAINKETFEFTCTSEETAKNVQEEINHYTAFQINEIISGVIASQISNNADLKIDKLEIDLGNISLKDFGSHNMLEKFESILTEQITGISNSPQHSSYTHNTAGDRQFVTEQNELDIIKEFILRGDVPWWFDKNEPITPDVMLRRLVHQSPEAVKQFLKENSNHKEALLRIAWQCKPSTRLLINTLISDHLPASAGTSLFMIPDPELPDSFLSWQQLKKLTSIFTQSKHLTSRSHKRLLVNRLLKMNDVGWVKRLSHFNKLTHDDLSTTEEFINSNKTSRRNKKDSRAVG